MQRRILYVGVFESITLCTWYILSQAVHIGKFGTFGKGLTANILHPAANRD